MTKRELIAAAEQIIEELGIDFKDPSVDRGFWLGEIMNYEPIRGYMEANDPDFPFTRRPVNDVQWKVSEAIDDAIDVISGMTDYYTSLESDKLSEYPEENPAAAEMLLSVMARSGDTFTRQTLVDALRFSGRRGAEVWVDDLLEDALKHGIITKSGGMYLMRNKVPEVGYREPQRDYMKRCMHGQKRADRPQKQKVAICFSKLRDAGRKVNPLLRFSDRMNIETGGKKLEVIEKRDGFYVVGRGMMIPVRDREEGRQVIEEFMSQGEQAGPRGPKRSRGGIRWNPVPDEQADFAKEFRGNWHAWSDFGWHDQPDDADEWGIMHLDNRDSDHLAQSNAEAIRKILGEYDEDEVRFQRFRHWGVGWVDAVAVKVYEKRTRKSFRYTPAFDALWEIVQRLENYPVLDEEDVSAREYEATLENIANAAPMTIENVPEDWPSQVFSWLWSNNQEALTYSQQDDGSYYPKDDAIAKALAALGLLHPEEYEAYDLEPAPARPTDIPGQGRLFNPRKRR